MCLLDVLLYAPLPSDIKESREPLLALSLPVDKYSQDFIKSRIRCDRERIQVSPRTDAQQVTRKDCGQA